MTDRTSSGLQGRKPEVGGQPVLFPHEAGRRTVQGQRGPTRAAPSNTRAPGEGQQHAAPRGRPGERASWVPAGEPALPYV